MLPKQPAPIFGRTTNFEYKKCLPDSVFQSFAPTGRHAFRWQNQAGEWWVPSQSYLRIRFAFCAVKEDGTGFRPIQPSDGVAPVMNLPPHLFSRMEYYMDGNKLSELQDYVPQIDTMKHRMMKSRAYMSAVGNRACFWHPDFAKRQDLICPNVGISAQCSTLRTGDIPGQRILINEGKIILHNGFSVAVGTADQQGFFGKYIPAASVGADANTPPEFPEDIEVYGLQFRSVGAKSTFSERMERLGTEAAYENAHHVPPVLGAKQVLLTMTYTGGETKTLVATWDQTNDLFLVHKQTQTLGDDSTEKISSTYPRYNSRLIQFWQGNVYPAPFEPVRTLAERNVLDATDSFVVQLVITPIEPSQQIAGAARHEICWKPTLGIFDVAHALPTTRHELHLQIPADYQTRCFDFGKTQPVPSWVDDRILDTRLTAQSQFAVGDRGKVHLRIESIEYFAAMASGPRADDVKYVLDLREYRMMPQTIPLTQTTSSSTYAFNLAPNTSSVSVAFQSLHAGNGSTSLSKFIVPTKVHQHGAETALSRFYVNFANQNRPREENESYITYQGPNTAVSLGNTRDNTTTQFFTQRYLETMTNTGQLFKPGGCETLEEWLERGAYYNWMWPRDGNDLSTRFHVFVAFEAATQDGKVGALETELVKRGWPQKIAEQNNDIQILIFDMIPRAFSLSLRNGSVVSAETTSAMVADGVRRIRTE